MLSDVKCHPVLTSNVILFCTSHLPSKCGKSRSVKAGQSLGIGGYKNILDQHEVVLNAFKIPSARKWFFVYILPFLSDPFVFYSNKKSWSVLEIFAFWYF